MQEVFLQPILLLFLGLRPMVQGFRSLKCRAAAASPALLQAASAPTLPLVPQLGQARTPIRVAAKPPRPGHREWNKENLSQLNGTTLSGGCSPAAPAQRNHSVNSVASTYSEFAVIHLF